jgi:hypothetical protein
MLESGLPTDLPSFIRRFGSEDACRDHLFKLKWPDGFLCRACAGTRCYRLETRLSYECSACGSQHALLAGTVFEQTKSPLSTWFLAIYWFLASKGGVSALELKRHMGFKSDQTAWTWLHKLRRAMAVRGTPLEGPVEVDETLLGGPEPGKRGRGAGGKTLVAGAVETRLVQRQAPDASRLSGAAHIRAEALCARLAANPGEVQRCLRRIRLGVIADASAEALGRFIDAAVAGDATIATDGWAAYRKGRRGRPHQRTVVSKSEGKAHDHLPAVHLVFTLLKRNIAGTYHGGIGRHLPAYLDEYVFRFNRKSLTPVRNALTVVARAMTTEPFTNRMIFMRT